MPCPSAPMENRTRYPFWGIHVSLTVKFVPCLLFHLFFHFKLYMQKLCRVETLIGLETTCIPLVLQYLSGNVISYFNRYKQFKRSKILQLFYKEYTHVYKYCTHNMRRTHTEYTIFILNHFVPDVLITGHVNFEEEKNVRIHTLARKHERIHAHYHHYQQHGYYRLIIRKHIYISIHTSISCNTLSHLSTVHAHKIIISNPPLTL